MLHTLGLKFKKLTQPIFCGLSTGVRTYTNPTNAYEASLVALSGPTLGWFTSIIISILGYRFDSQALIAIADIGFEHSAWSLYPDDRHVGRLMIDSLSKYYHLGLLVAWSTPWVRKEVSGTVSHLYMWIVLAFITVRRWRQDSSQVLPTNLMLTNKQAFVVGGGYVTLLGLLVMSYNVNKRGKKN